MRYTTISLFIPFRSKRKISLLETYKIVKNAGFEYIDVDNIKVSDVGREAVHKEIEEALAATGLKVSSYLAFMEFPLYGGEREKRVKEIIREEMDFCKKIGAPLFMATPYGYQEDVWRYGREVMAQKLSEALRTAVAYAEEIGIRAGIEDAPDIRLPMCSEAETGRLLRENPGLGLFFDTGNMYPMQEDPLRYYKNFRQKIVHVHIKDLRYTKESDEYQGDLVTNGKRVDGTTIGTGIVPLKELTAEMRKDGYAGFLSLEYAPSDNGQSLEAYEEELRQNLENLRKIAEDQEE